MTTRERWLLLVAAGLLACWGLYGWLRRGAGVSTGATLSMQPVVSGNPYTLGETRDFFGAVQKAEAIAEPLQRCLDYPDPPGSHWSPAAVAAYCRNQLVAGITFDELKGQIEAGHADAVDRRMSELLQRQLAKPGSPDLLDATFEIDFDRSSSDIRPILDAWKRQSPQSAYAYAASGVAYTRAAWDARGTAWAQNTPQSNFDAMHRLSTEAAADLDRAIALDKRITIAYSTMIRLAGLNGSAVDAFAIADRALAVDPANYLLYSRLMWLAQPKWGGSIEIMRNVADAAQRHAKDNPALAVIANQPEAVASGLDDCGCNGRAIGASAYRQVFDQVTAKSWLGGAGLSARKAEQYVPAVIYLSEALRFAPQSTDYLVGRSNVLTILGQHDWAMADANRAIASDPSEKTAWTARGYAYESVNDFAHAEQDFRQALRLIPEDSWTLAELGRIYVYSTHDWDKGWNVANQLIQNHPEDAAGWILRASIQKDQPRPGLDDTVNYFLSHFGNDPDVQTTVAQMRQYLTQESRRTN